MLYRIPDRRFPGHTRVVEAARFQQISERANTNLRAKIRAQGGPEACFARYSDLAAELKKSGTPEEAMTNLRRIQAVCLMWQHHGELTAREYIENFFERACRIDAEQEAEAGEWMRWRDGFEKRARTMMATRGGRRQ